MNKTEFMEELGIRLAGLPQSDLEERLSFYSEMIDDRIEDGIAEEDAVAGIGTVDEIADQIVSEIPLTKLVKEQVRKQRSGLRGWEIALLIIGAPLWLPLVLAALAVILAVYLSFWAVVAAVWAADLALAVWALRGVAVAVTSLFRAELLSAVLYLGLSVLSAGLAMLLFIGCVSMTRWMAQLSKRMVLGVKNMFIGRESE